MRNIICFLIFILLCYCLIACLKSAEKETYLIPQGYKGNIVLVLNKPAGTPKKYADGRRIYNIPKSGILISQFDKTYGVIDKEFYYVDENNAKSLLQSFDIKDMPNDLDSNKIYVFYGRGFNIKYPSDTNNVGVDIFMLVLIFLRLVI